MTIEQSVSIEASAAKVYNALTSADQFSEATGAPAETPAPGGQTCLMCKVVSISVGVIDPRMPSVS